MYREVSLKSSLKNDEEQILSWTGWLQRPWLKALVRWPTGLWQLWQSFRVHGWDGRQVYTQHFPRCFTSFMLVGKRKTLLEGGKKKKAHMITWLAFARRHVEYIKQSGSLFFEMMRLKISVLALIFNAFVLVFLYVGDSVMWIWLSAVGAAVCKRNCQYMWQVKCPSRSKLESSWEFEKQVEKLQSQMCKADTYWSTQIYNANFVKYWLERIWILAEMIVL